MAGRIIEAKARPARAAAAKKPLVPAPVGQAQGVAKPQVRLLTVDEGSDGQRLDNFLLREIKGVPKTLVYRVIRAGEVRVNKGRAQADTRLAIGDVVRIPPVRVPEPSGLAEAAPPREFPVLWEDEHLLVIDKPAGVAVHGGSGVSFGVIEQLRRARPQAKFLELVHRLDKETSGVLVLAKKRSALTHLQDQFRGRETGKTYAALVWGDWPEKLKVIDVALHKYLDADWRAPGAPSDEQPRPRGRASQAFHHPGQGHPTPGLGDAAGCDHQDRPHAPDSRATWPEAGHAIVGDPKYGDFTKNRDIARGPKRFERMFLHARRLKFTHPATQAELCCEAALPL